MLRRFLRMMNGVEMVSMCKVGMMTSLLVGTRLVVFRCLAMMPGSMFVVFRRLLVVVCAFMLSHL